MELELTWGAIQCGVRLGLIPRKSKCENPHHAPLGYVIDSRYPSSHWSVKPPKPIVASQRHIWETLSRRLNMLGVDVSLHG